MRELDDARERVGVDRVVVVLARDLHPPGRLVAHRVVGTVVAEPQLVGVAAEREPEDLVTEADAEQRDLADEPAHDLRHALHRGRVAGAVRQEDAVGIAGEDVGRGRGRGHHLDVTPRADEVAQDRALDPEVVRDHAERRVLVARGVGLVGGDGGDEVDAVGGARGRRRGAHRRLVGAERAGHRALVAEVTGEAAGVDPGDAAHAVLAQQVVERPLGPPVARARRARSRTTTPEQNGRRLSLSSALTP